MRRPQIEHWALQIVEHVEKGNNVEDDLVEVKSKWPDDHHKTARQLAGHANAARGEPILFMVGLDEGNHKVTGADKEELANWWQQVSKHFKCAPPPMQTYNVPSGSAQIVVLYFETDAAPFVVATKNGGQVESEVPWREGNSTRTATRSDLLKILVPTIKIPEVELLYAVVELIDEGDTRRVVELQAQFYVEPKSPEPVVFPNHRATATITGEDGIILEDHSPLEIRGPGLSPVYNSRESDISAKGGVGWCGGPGIVVIETQAVRPHGIGIDVKAEELSCELGVSGTNRSIRLQTRLEPKDSPQTAKLQNRRWVYGRRAVR
ncbi:MAG TPA: hypothetical protein PL033_03430 [Candidatus Brocadiia bacterium]|nr:hypothetical protein [Candidatus Brocadiia bacterium]